MSLTHYHKCIRKVTLAFTSLFNNIFLIKDDGQRVLVPIEFGDKEKFVKRWQNDPELDKKIQISLPRMTYIFNGFRYDNSRKLNTNNKNFAQGSTPDTVFSQYNPVPYDFDFSLTIYTRNVEDGNQIIEQIIPYFTPEYTLRVNLVPEMGIIKNLPIILNRAEPTIDSDGLFNSEVRTVFWTLNFTIKGFIFGGIKDAPIIKTANTNLSVNNGYSSGGFDSCCESGGSREFIVLENGYGDYVYNELVYQGYNLDTAHATGIVKYWSNTSNTLYITDICGNFLLNQPIIGTDSLSIHVPQRNSSNTIIALRVTAVPEPNTATANSYWIANTTVTEYPNTM